MARGLSYRDAATLLGAESRIFQALNRAAGGMLIAGTAGGAEVALGLFDAKAEFVQHTKDLGNHLIDKARGLSWLSRAERIEAAHAVIVVAAFFETLSLLDDRRFFIDEDVQVNRHRDWSKVPPEISDPIAKGIRWRARQARAEQRRVAGGPDRRDNSAKRQLRAQYPPLKPSKISEILAATSASPSDARLRTIAETLLTNKLPAPAPQRPFEKTLDELRELYGRLAQKFAEATLGVDWDSLEQRERQRFSDAFQVWAADMAIRNYQDHFRSLASEFAEVAFWANAIDHQATRGSIESLRIGLQGLERALRELVTGTRPDVRRTALSKSYTSALERPIVETGDIPSEGMRIPNLGQAYINPSFRACDADVNAPLHHEQFWRERSTLPREDLQAFLLGYFASANSTESPLLILGQPGSGKSVLTKMLAARLPADDFLTIRIVLREVPAEADIQTQIEHAIYDATGERVTWTDLVRSVDAAIPVLLFDGFDELLQATGVSQSDYLERIARFQERESTQGRPCIALVTSRTAVADRARIPTGGLVAVRLEAFADQQIGIWVDVWNSSNADYFSTHNRRPLSAQSLYSQGDIATQPLLLLMLALYDATDNALQSEQLELRNSEVYERLLRSFAEREVCKLATPASPDELGRRVERELSRLSFAAVAMFNRSRPWATLAELNEDLPALSDESPAAPSVPSTSFRPELTAGETILGRFFFIHEARAIVEGIQRGTVEFLHATFGEYLVARVVAKELEELVATEEFSLKITRNVEATDDFIYALASFAPLSARATTIDFLLELLSDLAPNKRRTLRKILIRFFVASQAMRSGRRYEAYEPVRLSVPARYANYSANLLVLILLVCDSARARELFPEADDPAGAWQRHAMFHRSQLSADAWRWLSTSIRFSRLNLESGGRDVAVWLGSDGATNLEGEILEGQALYWSLQWTFDPMISSWSAGDYRSLRRSNEFSSDPDLELLSHALAPVMDRLGPSLTSLVGRTETGSFSAANALLKLWVASGTRAHADELAAAYDECFEAAICMIGGTDQEAIRAYKDVLVHQLGTDLARLPGHWRDQAKERLRRAANAHPDLAQWASAVITSLGLRGKPSTR